MRDRIGRYTLIGQTPVRCDDLLEWARWIEQPGARIVARTEVGPYTVSTIFLGLDHRFMGGGPPILFETMVYVTASGSASGSREPLLGREHHLEFLDIQERCSTWLQAEQQHAAVIAQIREPGDPVRDVTAEEIESL